MDTEAKQVVDYLRSLDENPNANLIIECADESVVFPDAMQKGLQGSFISYAADQLSSNIPLASCKEDPIDFLRIALEQSLGNDIRRMGFHGSYEGDVFKSFLNTALNKPLNMFTRLYEWRIKNAVDASCWDMLVDLCSNPHLKILHISDIPVSSHSTPTLDSEIFALFFIEALRDKSVIAALTEANKSNANEVADMVILKLGTRVKYLEEELKSTKKELKEVRDILNELEGEADYQEQYSRRTSIRITGLPENNEENMSDLVNDLFKTMNINPVINRVHQVGSKDQNKRYRCVASLGQMLILLGR
ncbi:hypothetical protein CAPTEDRAFT_210634 [Capitella teleta]|uniref:Uncharacterized protein n=1 Tax=Capitella teleta TaxID=283909 RepID=R7UYF7_CAPTE|nr:hypothetical protein CAPTEDRAFT_210634 [Capitella teleta]|eukprot:ELU11349.1 hypothetical protein CAPTEDRAFT_210634 [Capitella teleta]